MPYRQVNFLKRKIFKLSVVRTVNLTQTAEAFQTPMKGEFHSEGFNDFLKIFPSQALLSL